MLFLGKIKASYTCTSAYITSTYIAVLSAWIQIINIGLGRNLELGNASVSNNYCDPWYMEIVIQCEQWFIYMLNLSIPYMLWRRQLHKEAVFLHTYCVSMHVYRLKNIFYSWTILEDSEVFIKFQPIVCNLQRVHHRTSQEISFLIHLFFMFSHPLNFCSAITICFVKNFQPIWCFQLGLFKCAR